MKRRHPEPGVSRAKDLARSGIEVLLAKKLARFTKVSIIQKTGEVGRNQHAAKAHRRSAQHLARDGP
jgi:hypothetical protein